MRAVSRVEDSRDPESRGGDDAEREPTAVTLARANHGQLIRHQIDLVEQAASLARGVPAHQQGGDAAAEQGDALVVFSGVEMAPAGNDRPVAGGARIAIAAGHLVEILRS